jgi:hypothetical protein
MNPVLAALITTCIISVAQPLVGQAFTSTVRSTSFVESRQGHHPGGPDRIGHGIVSQEDVLMCVLVGVYDETHKAQTACVVKFKEEFQVTLKQGQSIQSPENGEFSLICRGQVPRRCMIEVNPPPAKIAARSDGSR